ncbi:hypothetical protein B0T25DRAFT_588050 [Lasiosphaeria hispida]|uniref:NAD(P)-binding protein n=1 Tax=Lasiosphaeria hispida TaxID=260671 RepID=A0AAJ0HPU6_9PEZI|nr:hypothetical protein B0T25DRAFT_588050 [Lasiosphaeria hispida]
MPVSPIPAKFFLDLIKHQFTPIPLPTTDCTGQTIIVTGANAGIGLEAARHYARLGAAKLILACRSTAKGEAAKANIEASLATPGVTTIEVWPLDLCSFESVRHFCRRADTTLPRLDIFLANAGISTFRYSPAPDAEGYESTIATNVISTFLMAFMLLPTLRRTAAQHNTTPHLTIVTSDSHTFAEFSERNAPAIFPTYLTTAYPMADRYTTSKLLSLLLTRELADRAPSPVVINCVNPGFCRSTNLFDDWPVLAALLLRVVFFPLSRSADTGARVLLAAADGGPESHGAYLESGHVSTPSAYVSSTEGGEMQKRVWGELVVILEGVEPGVSKGV